MTSSQDTPDSPLLNSSIKPMKERLSHTLISNRLGMHQKRKANLVGVEPRSEAFCLTKKQAVGWRCGAACNEDRAWLTLKRGKERVITPDRNSGQWEKYTLDKFKKDKCSRWFETAATTKTQENRFQSKSKGFHTLLMLSQLLWDLPEQKRRS